MDDKKSTVKSTKSKSVSTSTTNGKADKWWTTPRTQAFIETREALDTAFDELMLVEAKLKACVEQKTMCRHRNPNLILQSLTHECIQFLVRQEMAKCPEWQAAWERFAHAVVAAEAATTEFRDEIETATAKKPAKVVVPTVAIDIAQATIVERTRKISPKARQSA